MSNMGKTRLISLKLPCPCKATKGRPRISAVKKKLNLFLSTFYGDLMCSSLGACVCYEKKRDGSRVGSWRLDLVAKGASKLDGNDASLKEAVSSIKGKIEGVEYSGEFVRVIVLCNHVHPCPCK